MRELDKVSKEKKVRLSWPRNRHPGLMSIVSKYKFLPNISTMIVNVPDLFETKVKLEIIWTICLRFRAADADRGHRPDDIFAITPAAIPASCSSFPFHVSWLWVLSKDVGTRAQS
jgi:hypothetical protein